LVNYSFFLIGYINHFFEKLLKNSPALLPDYPIIQDSDGVNHKIAAMQSQERL